MTKTTAHNIGMPLVGLDIGAISSSNSAVLRFEVRQIKPSFSP